jgi:hypothetical protein
MASHAGYVLTDRGSWEPKRFADSTRAVCRSQYSSRELTGSRGVCGESLGPGLTGGGQMPPPLQ